LETHVRLLEGVGTRTSESARTFCPYLKGIVPDAELDEWVRQNQPPPVSDYSI
jgi:hypothetical protein